MKRNLSNQLKTEFDYDSEAVASLQLLQTSKRIRLNKNLDKSNVYEFNEYQENIYNHNNNINNFNNNNLNNNNKTYNNIYNNLNNNHTNDNLDNNNININNNMIGLLANIVVNNPNNFQNNKTLMENNNKNSFENNRILMKNNKTLNKNNKTLIKNNKTLIKNNKTLIKNNKTLIKNNKTLIENNKTSILNDKNSILNDKNSILSNKTSILNNKNSMKTNEIEKNSKERLSLLCKQTPKWRSWPHIEEVFLIGAVMERFFTRGSLSSSKKNKADGERCWTNIRKIYDHAWKRYGETEERKTEKPFSFTTRPANALARHYKVMKERVIHGNDKTFLEYYEEWEKYYNYNNCLLRDCPEVVDSFQSDEQLYNNTKSDEAELSKSKKSELPKSRWSYEEEVFLVAALMERFFKRGSLASTRMDAGINECWTSIKQTYDFIKYNYENVIAKKQISRVVRSARALTRHFKVMKVRFAESGGKDNLKKYFHDWKTKYNINECLLKTNISNNCLFNNNNNHNNNNHNKSNHNNNNKTKIESQVNNRRYSLFNNFGQTNVIPDIPLFNNANKNLALLQLHYIQSNYPMQNPHPYPTIFPNSNGLKVSNDIIRNGNNSANIQNTINLNDMQNMIKFYYDRTFSGVSTKT